MTVRRRLGTFVALPLGLLGLSQLTGCGSGDAELAASGAELTNGNLVPKGKHGSVAYVLTQRTTLPNPSNCTGTLVADDLVLTAAHCVVCADPSEGAVTIQFMAGSQADGLPGPYVFESAANGAWFNPDAYPGVDCSVHPEKPVWHADVALVKLKTPAPAWVPRSKVLLHGGPGFAPAQDLHGAPLTLVGRGQQTWNCDGIGPSNTECGATFMREGTNSLWKYRPLELVDGACGFTSSGFMLLTRGDPNGQGPNSGVRRGDSGGPMFANVAGSSHVIGVASGGYFLSESAHTWHAPTFTKQNADWLGARLQANYVALPDQDSDQVVDSLDNCPGDANPDQIDRDGDGLGDVCDNCTPLNDSESGLPPLDEHDGTPTSQFASFKNASQANCNYEAEIELLVQKDPLLIEPSTKEPRRTSLAAYRAHFPGYDGESQIPGCKDTLLAHKRRVVRGDACDPVPCGKSTLAKASIDKTLAPGFLCAPPPGTLGGMCALEVPGKIAVAPTKKMPVLPGAFGFRHCACSGPHASLKERRMYCQDPAQDDCAIDPSRFSPGVEDDAWRWMSIDNVPASGGFLATASFPGQKKTLLWDSLTDLSRLNGNAALPPPPWDASHVEGGQFKAGPELTGVLWTHVAELDGVPIGSVPKAGGDRPYALLASHYGPADFEITIASSGKPIPETKAPFPWTYCAECILGIEMSWLWAVDDAIVAVQPRGHTQVQRAVGEAARELIASPALRVPAAESSALMELSGLARRELLIDLKSPGLAVSGGLGVQANQIVGELRTGAALQTLSEKGSAGSGQSYDFELPAAGTELDFPDHSALVVTYSAIRNELFALARLATGQTALYAWSARTGQWKPAQLTGAALGVPLAMTYLWSDAALYVVDESALVGGARLVRVDLLTGHASVLSSQLLTEPFAALSLSVTEDGLLLLAGSPTSNPRTTKLAQLEIAGGNARVVARAERAGAFAGEARANAAGAHLLMRERVGFSPVLVTPEEFSPATGKAQSPNPALL